MKKLEDYYIEEENITYNNYLDQSILCSNYSEIKKLLSELEISALVDLASSYKSRYIHEAIKIELERRVN